MDEQVTVETSSKKRAGDELDDSSRAHDRGSYTESASSSGSGYARQDCAPALLVQLPPGTEAVQDTVGSSAGVGSSMEAGTDLKRRAEYEIDQE